MSELVSQPQVNAGDLAARGWFLGIDTSFYTTSLAAVSADGRLLAERRSMLPVPTGQRGIRPQEGVFLHLTSLPGLLEELLDQIRAGAEASGPSPLAVAASVRPLPQPDSYLPLFRVSEGFGRSLAAAWQVPFIPTTHQEGHLMAGAWSGGMPLDGPFVAAHLSGGTTDILEVRPQAGGGFQVTRLGEGKDLHIGQFIDRVGVALGLPFPAGPALEELASTGRAGAVTLPSSADRADLSFSGPEAAALRAIAHGAGPAEVAYAAQACVARSVEKALRWALQAAGLDSVLVVGGVAANAFLRRELERRVPARLSFGKPSYSTDNAAGVALIGRAAFRLLKS